MWSHSDTFDCRPCTDTSYNGIKLFMIFLYNILMLMSSVNSTLTLITMYIFADVFIRLGAGTLRLDKTSIIIKILINYLQIVSVFFTF